MRLPGWDSLPFVDRAHSWLELAGIICLALLVIAEVLRWQYGNREKVLLKRIEPPHALTEEQRSAIAEKAKGLTAELEIVSIIGDAEAKNLSDDIAAALRSVDWTVQQTTPYFIQKPNQPLIVFVPDRDHPPAAADALIRGLQAAGLLVEGQGGLDQKPGRIQLIIGERAR